MQTTNDERTDIAKAKKKGGRIKPEQKRKNK